MSLSWTIQLLRALKLIYLAAKLELEEPWKIILQLIQTAAALWKIIILFLHFKLFVLKI